jgi:hypothetical protein
MWNKRAKIFMGDEPRNSKVKSNASETCSAFMTRVDVDLDDGSGTTLLDVYS